MTIAFAPDACAKHPLNRPVAGGLALLALSLLAGCPAPPVVDTLEARPSGRYGEVLSWTATPTADCGTHRVDVQISIDEAQLMGWAKTTHAYSAFIDVDVVGEGLEVDEQWMRFPITEERTVGEDGNTVQIAYLAAGELQPSGYRTPPAQRALTFDPGTKPVTLTAHVRTPAGADRKVLRAIHDVKLMVRRRGDCVVTGWEAQEPTIRE